MMAVAWMDYRGNLRGCGIEMQPGGKELPVCIPLPGCAVFHGECGQMGAGVATKWNPAMTFSVPRGHPFYQKNFSFNNTV